MAEPVRVRRLRDQEGQKLQRIVRRGTTSSVRYRRAMMLLASAGGNRVPVIAQLVQADEDTVRDVIRRLNEIGLAALAPRWAGGRPRLLSPDDEDFVVATAKTRPTPSGPALHPLVDLQTRRLPAHRPGSGDRHRPQDPALPARPTRRHLPAHQDVEGIHRPPVRRQTRPHRACPGALTRPGFRVRRVRAAGHPPHRRELLGRGGPQGRRPVAGGPEVHPRRTPRRRPHLRDHGQSVRTQGHQDPHLGEETPGGAVLYPDQRLLGRPNRSPLRTPCGSSRWPTPTTATTPFRPGPYTPTCAGATPTPGTPTSWQPSAANAPVSAARRASAGADAPSLPQPDHQGDPAAPGDNEFKRYPGSSP